MNGAAPNRFFFYGGGRGGGPEPPWKKPGAAGGGWWGGGGGLLEKAANFARKTAYDLIAVEKGALLINMDAQAPNRAFQEWAAQGHFLPDLKSIQPEYHYGESRLDFALTTEAGLHLVEVKGVTLEENGVVRFPDAPTEQGVKHIHELQRAVREGLGATLFL